MQKPGPWLVILVAVLLSGLFLRDGHTQGTVTVRGFGDSRSITGSLSGESFSFVTGPGSNLARSRLLDPANFGPSGIVPEAVTFAPSVDEVSLSVLQETDVFVVSPITPKLTPTEVCTLEVYVKEGGALLEVRNVFSSRPRILGTLPGQFVSDPTADITSAGAATPIITGPFSTVVTITTGANGNYSQIGSSLVVATNSGVEGNGPNILLLSPATGFTGSGRAVFIGDEESFMTGVIPGERDGQLDPARSPFNDNEKFLLNIFAFLAGAPGLSAGADFRICAPLAMQELITEIEALNLKVGISNSLDAKIDAAVRALDEMNQKNDIAAINALEAFSNAVNAQRNVHIEEEKADRLEREAQQIMELLELAGN